ncbi:Transposable element Tcb1 transposase [Dictyocoela muelleri]|nr:Transposable element Tcb1 transposase [Dictyocoela muelleri]
MQPSDQLRLRILFLSGEGKTQKEISKKTGVHQSTVSRILKKYDETGSIKHRKGNGRPKKLNTNDIKILNKIIKKDSKKSLRKVANELRQNGGSDVSYVTIKNWHNENKRFAYAPIRKPLLSKINISRRESLSEEFTFYSKDEIKRIIFSDESKFNLFNSDGRVSVWREPKKGLELKNLSPTVKHGGGSVMCWGCFSYQGTGKLVFIDGKMDADAYIEIIKNNLQASATSMNLTDYTFQQDNDPKHTSKKVKKFFAYKRIELLPWPSQSPDLNPIESLWGIIKANLSKYTPKNKEELKVLILNEWNSISIETCQKLAMSFEKRAKSVFKAKGGHTKY